MIKFSSFIKLNEQIETNPVKVDVYHGSGQKFNKFDQKQSRVLNDNMGGGTAYFTNDLVVASTYAKSMAKSQKTNTPYVYHTTLNMQNVFDVDHEFTGEKLKHVLPNDPKDHEDFARSSGLLKFGDDKHTVLNNLRSGKANLTGEQVFKGLSKGNVNTAKAREHLESKGFDGIRYNGGVGVENAIKHSVYIPYKPGSIKINGIAQLKSKPKIPVTKNNN